MHRSTERIITTHVGSLTRPAEFTPEVHPYVVWATFDVLVEGAHIATSRVWS